MKLLDSGFRNNDAKGCFGTFTNPSVNGFPKLRDGRSIRLFLSDERRQCRLPVAFGQKHRGRRQQGEKGAGQVAPLQAVHEDIELGADEGPGLAPGGERRQIVDDGAGHGNAEGHAGVAHDGQQARGHAPELGRCAAHDGAVDRALEHAGA